MEIKMVNIDQIKPYESNPRINDAAVDAVAVSLREYGFRQPLVVDEAGVIIVGHTRWKAAKKLGLAKVPVHVAKDLSPEKAKAYRIADNQTNTLADWDYDLLPIELKDLQAADFDLSVLGFDADELAKMLNPDGTPGLTDPDEVPDPPKEPNAKIYQGAAGTDLGALEEMSNAKDVTLSLEAGEADVTTRANQGWRATAPTLRECTVEFEMLWQPGDSGFNALKTAFLTSGLVRLAILTGAVGAANTEGPVGDFSITNFSRSEPLEEGVTVSVTAKLAVFDQWYSS